MAGNWAVSRNPLLIGSTVLTVEDFITELKSHDLSQSPPNRVNGSHKPKSDKKTRNTARRNPLLIGSTVLTGIIFNAPPPTITKVAIPS